MCLSNVGRVAFGSRAWELLHRFDDEAGRGTPVLIYASMPSEPRGHVVSWVARWWAVVDATTSGGHPEADLVRPPSTIPGGEDEERYWFAFWEVTDLRPLARESWIAIRSLRRLSGGKFNADFIPEGPTLLGALPSDVPEGV